MKLLTKQILADFKKQGYTDGKPKDQVKIILKLFNPTGSETWYMVEYDEKTRTFFGLFTAAGMYNPEYGYSSLDEIQAFRGRLGLGIERDMHFGTHYLQEVLDGGRL